MSDIKGGASQARVPASCHSNSEAISDETSLEHGGYPIKYHMYKSVAVSHAGATTECYYFQVPTYACA